MALQPDVTRTKRLTPTAIRRSSVSAEDKGRFVVSLTDALASPGLYERLEDAEKEYWDALPEWRKRISRIRERKSSVVERWALANEILRFESRLRRRWGIQPTNTLTAVSLDLGVSKSALGYMFRLRERFSLQETKAIRIGWSKIQEILDIEDHDMMMKCLEMVRKRILSSDGDIRKFKKKANSQGVSDRR